MFKTAYQGDSSVEVFTARGSSDSQLGLNKWRLTGGSTIRKEFSKKARGPIVIAQGSTSASSMMLPRDATAQHLGLIQPVLVLQICFLPPTVKSRCDYALCMNVRDSERQQHRLQFCSINVCRNDRNQTHDFRQFKAYFSEQLVPRGKWLNLFIDVESVVRQVYGAHLATIDSLQLCGTFKLRRIFTLNGVPESEMATFHDVPSRYHFHTGIDFRNIVLRMQASNQTIVKAIETGTDKQFLSVSGHNNGSTSNLTNDEPVIVRTDKKAHTNLSSRQKSATNIPPTARATAQNRTAGSVRLKATTSSSETAHGGASISNSAAMAIGQQQQKTLGNAKRLEALLKTRDQMATQLAHSNNASSSQPSRPARSASTINSASSKRPSFRTKAANVDDDGYRDDFLCTSSSKEDFSDRHKTDETDETRFAAGDATATVRRRPTASTHHSPPPPAATRVDDSSQQSNSSALDELIKGDFLRNQKHNKTPPGSGRLRNESPLDVDEQHLRRPHPRHASPENDDDSDFPVLPAKSPAAGTRLNECSHNTAPASTTNTSDSERDGNRTETIRRHESLTSIPSSSTNSNRTYTKASTTALPTSFTARFNPALSTTSEESGASGRFTATDRLHVNSPHSPRPIKLTSSASEQPTLDSGLSITGSSVALFRDTTPVESAASYAAYFRTNPARDDDDDSKTTVATADDDDYAFSFSAFSTTTARRAAGRNPPAKTGSGSGTLLLTDHHDHKSTSRFTTLGQTAGLHSQTSVESSSDEGLTIRRPSGDSTITSGSGRYDNDDETDDTLCDETPPTAISTSGMRAPAVIDKQRLITTTTKSAQKIKNFCFSHPSTSTTTISGGQQQQRLSSASDKIKNHTRQHGTGAARIINTSRSTIRQQQHHSVACHQNTISDRSGGATSSGIVSNNNSHRASPVDYNNSNNNKNTGRNNNTPSLDDNKKIRPLRPTVSTRSGKSVK